MAVTASLAGALHRDTMATGRCADRAWEASGRASSRVHAGRLERKNSDADDPRTFTDSYVTDLCEEGVP